MGSSPGAHSDDLVIEALSGVLSLPTLFICLHCVSWGYLLNELSAPQSPWLRVCFREPTLGKELWTLSFKGSTPPVEKGPY